MMLKLYCVTHDCLLIIILCRAFPTVEAVLDAAVYTVAMQLSRDPLVRRAVRLAFYERAKISCRPTKRGKKVSLLLDHDCICKNI